MADDLRLTDTQLKILEALCRPAAGGNRFAPPATNQEIADELFLSVDAIKAHLRVLFRKFGIEDLPHNQKRARLVELALERGVIDGDGDVVAETPAHPVPSTNPEVFAQKQGRRPSGRLIGAGVAVGIVAVAVLVVVLTSGGSGGGGDGVTQPEFVKGVNSACTSAVNGTNVAAKEVPSPDSLLSAITNVQTAVDDLGMPSYSAPGLSSFTDGLNKAKIALRNISNNTVADSATTFGGLTVASGLIQVGTAKLQLGDACTQLSEWVGATQLPGT